MKVMINTFILITVLFTTTYCALQDIVVHVKDDDGIYNTSWMNLTVKLVNNGSERYDLQNLKVLYNFSDRNPELIKKPINNVYWFTAYSADYTYQYTNNNAAIITLVNLPDTAPGSYATMNLEIKFSAGYLYPDGGEAIIQFGVRKTDWSNFNELDDYSHVNSTSYVQTNRTSISANYTWSNGQSAETLSKWKVFINWEGNVLSSISNGEVKEMDSVTISRNLVRKDIEDVAKYAFAFWKPVFPEISYSFIPTSSNATYNVYISATNTPDHSSAGWFSWNWNVTCGVDDHFYSSTNGPVFVDRNQAYYLVNNANLIPWIWQKDIGTVGTLYSRHRFRGYNNKWLPQHELIHTMGMEHDYVEEGPFSGVSDINAERESALDQGQDRSYNSQIFRSLDIAKLSKMYYRKPNNPANPADTMEEYMISYPYTAKFYRMENLPPDGQPENKRYYSTNNNYDARFKMFETPTNPLTNTNSPRLPGINRFFVTGIDSVRVFTSAGNGTAGDQDGANPGQAIINSPEGLCVDKNGDRISAGDVYFSSYAKIRRMSPDGNVATLAGTGVPGYVNGAASSAQFSADCNPFAIDQNGNLYISENSQSRIRKIDMAGQVTLFAGSASGLTGYVNAQGATARFNICASLAYDRLNNRIYVADKNNHRIRKIDMAGNVTTFAGSGTTGVLDGTLTAARFAYPTGLSYDETNKILYVSDGTTTGVNTCLRRINITTSKVETIAGSSSTAGYVDAKGSSARFGSITDMGVNGVTGVVYIADGANHCIRVMSSDSSVSTIAGTNTRNSYLDACGTDAGFLLPANVEADTKGQLYVTDVADHRVRKISAVIPLAVNAPKIGLGFSSFKDVHFYEFTVSEARNYQINVLRGVLLTDANMVLYGPDNFNSVAYQDVNGGNATYSGNLNPGKYLLKISTIGGTGKKLGAYTVRVNMSASIAIGGADENGAITYPGDNNWYEFDVITPGDFSITTSNTDVSLGYSNYIYLYRKHPWYSRPVSNESIPDYLVASNGGDITDSLGVGAGEGSITANLESGHYWVRVRAGTSLADAYSTGTYKLRVDFLE